MNDLIRARIHYAKRFPANLIGHLDTVSCLKRAMVRAAWPLKFSAGHNPHVKLSASPPLSLGFYSEAEYADVELVRHLERYQIDAFRGKTVKGIAVIDVRMLNEHEPEINSAIKGFRYVLDFQHEPSPRMLETLSKLDNGKYLLEVFGKNGSFKNPVKIVGEGSYRVKKTECIWHSPDAEEERK